MERKKEEDKQRYGLTLSTHCKLLWLDTTTEPRQVSRTSNKLKTRSLHHHPAVTTQLIQRRTGHTVKATYLWTETCETEPLWSCMKWGVCGCTSEASFQQSRGSDPLLPRPLVLLKTPPILSIYVCRVIFAQCTLALTHKHTQVHMLMTSETKAYFLMLRLFVLTDFSKLQCMSSLFYAVVKSHLHSTLYLCCTKPWGALISTVGMLYVKKSNKFKLLFDGVDMKSFRN